MNHIHVGLADFLVFVAQLILANFLLRALAVRWENNATGKALAWLI